MRFGGDAGEAFAWKIGNWSMKAAYFEKYRISLS